MALIVLVGSVHFQEEGEVHARENDVVTSPVEPHLRNAAKWRQSFRQHHEKRGQEQDDRDLGRTVRIDEDPDPGKSYPTEAFDDLSWLV